MLYITKYNQDYMLYITKCSLDYMLYITNIMYFIYEIMF